MFKCIYVPSNVPAVILDNVKLNRNVHKYSTRNASDFNFSSNYNPKNPLDFATHLWNKLPANVKCSNNYSKFIKLLKLAYRDIYQ